MPEAGAPPNVNALIGAAIEESLAVDIRAQVQRLEQEITKKEKRQTRLETLYFTCLTGGVFVLVAGLGLLVVGADDTQSWTFRLGVLGLMISSAALSAVPSLKARIRLHEAHILDHQFERDILIQAPTTSEIRADKLLRMNQQQLRRYYEMNLQQNTWVFVVGLGCLVLGVGVIAVTFYMLAQVRGDHASEQAVIAVVGGLGAILSNFVAAIYLRIHALNAQSTSEFHTTLVQMQQIFLANLIAASVSPADSRSQTFAKLSLSMLPTTLQRDPKPPGDVPK
jgi:Na+/melibiose symporter-like transporter